MRPRKNATPLLLIALAFVALGATGERTYAFVGIAFLAVYAVLVLRPRR